MYINAKGVELKTTNSGSQAITGAAGGVRTGSSGADMFSSLKGDTLTGGLGDDVYYLWESASKVAEKAGEGTDTVYVKYWGGYTLADNVENAFLQSNGATFATGNALNNVLVAGTVHATLNGGAGDDVLVGGAGADVFKIVAGNGSDAIYNFRPGWDAVSLSGYNFTTFAQLKAAASQVGSDVSVKLSASETLVLRDVQLGALGAADFGLPMPSIASIAPAGSTVYGANQATNANGWYVFNNVWGVGSMKEGKDYTVNSAFKTSDMIKGTTFTWSFAPNTDVSQTIKAYPEVIFGISPMNPVRSNPTDTKMVLPVKVSDLVGLTAAYDVSYSGNTGGFNVSYDIWLTSQAYGDKSTMTNEVMVWVHKGDFPAWGKVVGTYSKDGQTASIYHEGTYTAVVFDNDVPKGAIDVADILAKLGTLGIVSTSEYVAAIELGAEVVSGAGSLTINDLKLSVASKNNAGGITTKTVTGAGTTVVETGSGTTPPAGTTTTTTTLPAPPAEPSTPAAPPAPATPATLASFYKAGTEKLVDEHGLTIGSKTVAVTTSKVTINMTDVAGKSLGYDVVTMDGDARIVQHFNGAGGLVANDRIVIDSQGAVVTTHFTAAGVMLSTEQVIKEAGGAVTTQYFDAQFALTGADRATTDASGAVTVQHFDAKFALTGADKTIPNADGSVAVQHYDAAFNLTGAELYKTAGNSTTVYYYDAKWGLKNVDVHTVDANGATKTLNYDAAWKVIGNTLTGTDRADTLTGSSQTTHFYGGSGSDTLKGGSGVDYFHFDTPLDQGAVDSITSFSAAKDKIVLDASVFGAIGKAGPLDAGAFVAGTKALDSADRILWDKATGQVWYDDDGNGAHTPVLLAKVTADASLTAANFLVG